MCTTLRTPSTPLSAVIKDVSDESERSDGLGREFSPPTQSRAILAYCQIVPLFASLFPANTNRVYYTVRGYRYLRPLHQMRTQHPGFVRRKIVLARGEPLESSIFRPQNWRWRRRQLRWLPRRPWTNYTHTVHAPHNAAAVGSVSVAYILCPIRPHCIVHHSPHAKYPFIRCDQGRERRE